ncbi:tRNA (guanosine(37)-N1)-methyltransferase TrmD [Patescibacteria group bacterium]|nr:tRNA (guanosine(37)-N1)-methyltransferase TrmD [Patescibacteria group bacterium]MBU4141590.1 tRNA (guanosine(37)-N1)-methyltransferase TrmD [Patescibacteria group bacterium]
MRFDIITIFPKIFNSYFSESILARAQAKELIDINVHNLRDWAEGAHRQVDDRPFGGGPGMVLKVEPIFKAVKVLKLKVKSEKLKVKFKIKKTRVILLSAKGKRFVQKDVRRLLKYDQLIFICGRYEGVDERVAKHIADEEISIGDFVLTGGELPAMIVIDSISRHIPGVIGKSESLTEESFTLYNKDAKIKFIEYPHYTRPEIFEPNKKIKWVAPKVLLSGNHKKIHEWRIKNAKIKKNAD